jgi:hypothetical protein
MKHSLTVLAAFLLLATSAAHAEMVPSGTYTGTAAGTSSGDVLWSQLDEPTGSAFTDQGFEAVYAAYDSWGGEDFTVDATSWILDSLFTPGSVTVAGSNPFFVSHAFYRDAGGQPGAPIGGCEFPANTNFSSAGDGDFTTDVSGCSAPGGLTWFSQQIRMDFDPWGQHYWATRNSARSHPGVWKNPGNGFGNGCLDWQPANFVCGMTGEDWLFELSGTLGNDDPCLPPNKCSPAVGPFGVVLMVLSVGGVSAWVLRRRRGREL